MPVPVHDGRDASAGPLPPLPGKRASDSSKAQDGDSYDGNSLSRRVRGAARRRFFLVRFVDLPDVFTGERTLEEAQFNAAEALSSMLGWKLSNGQWIGNSATQPECA